jgi:hypothetical protein
MENPIGSFPPAAGQNEEQKKKKPSTAMKVTVLIALVVLLAVGILIPIKVVPDAVSSVASSITSFFMPKEDITLSTANTNITSGDTITLTWNGKHRSDGAYSLTYACVTGLHMESSTNQANESIACNSPFYFSPNDNSVDVKILSDASRFADAVITLGFLENGATTVDTLDEITITVTNSNNTDSVTPVATTTPSTPTETPATEEEEPATEEEPVVTPSRPVSNPNGMADLEVRPIAVGYLTETGVFVASASVSAHQQAAIKFQIVNVGDKNTGSWTFSADLPSDTDPRFTSGAQQNLGPGDRIEYVLGFKNIKNVAQNTAVVNADPSNMITERSKTNNSVRMIVINNQGQGTVSTGKADLVVRVLDTGIVNRSNGTYTPASTVGSNDRVAVRFEVQNVGTEATGSWRFQANLPTNDSNNVNFNSDTQVSLLPGQKATFTVAFENVKSAGNNTVTITVDSNANVSEANENNNSTTANIYRN